MPEAVATQPSAPSKHGQTILQHRHRRIGEARIDVARLSAEKRAAACSALSKT